MFVARKIFEEDLAGEQIECATYCGDYLFLGTTRRIIIYDIKNNKISFEKSERVPIKKIAASMNTNKNKIYIAYADMRGLYLNVLSIKEEKLELVREASFSYYELPTPFETIPDKISLSICPDGQPILILLWKTQKESLLFVYPFLQLLNGEKKICSKYSIDGLIKDYFLTESTCDIFVSLKSKFFKILQDNRASFISSFTSEDINQQESYFINPSCIRYPLQEVTILFVPENLVGMFLQISYYYSSGSRQTYIWIKVENKLFKESTLAVECTEYPYSKEIKCISKRDGLSFLALSESDVILFKVEGADLKEYASLPLSKFNISNPIYAFWTSDDKVFVITPLNVYVIDVKLTRAMLDIISRVGKELDSARYRIETEPESIVSLASMLDVLSAQIELIRLIQTLDERELKKKQKELQQILKYLKQTRELTSKELEKLSTRDREIAENILAVPQELLTVLSENPDKVTGLTIRLIELATKAIGATTNPLIFTVISAVNSVLWIIISKLRKSAY